jgi:hypothetical protein
MEEAYPPLPLDRCRVIAFDRAMNRPTQKLAPDLAPAMASLTVPVAASLRASVAHPSLMAG